MTKEDDPLELAANAYNNGLRDGRLKSLEKSVQTLTEDISKMKISMYMLYGAIAIVQFLPELREFLGGR